MENRYRFEKDISVVFPTMNEGESVRNVLNELIGALDATGKSYEIIAIDVPTKLSSFGVLREYADRYPNFTAIVLSDVWKAGSGKSVQYMIGFELAKGEYIFQIDSDGQDNPADIPKFLKKLDEGYDLVVGHKQKRKDGKGYMFWSKIGNTLTRVLTGTTVHDMNCGFKGYQSHAAKSLNLRGRWYRYIPSILAAKGYEITEVPIENRKREWGKTNFSFINRMQSGLFDMVVIAILNRFGDTPMYFWGWVAILMFLLSVLVFVGGVLTSNGIWRLTFLFFSSNLFVGGIIVYLLGIKSQFERKEVRVPLEDFGYREIYSGTNKKTIENKST